RTPLAPVPDRDDAPSWAGRADQLLLIRSFPEALEVADRAVELDESYAFAHNQRGRALGGLKRYGEALAAFTRATELDPKDAIAWANRARALLALDRFAEA